jgi:hypothetical protein
LTQHEVVESILDKLVSAPVSKGDGEETPTTEKVVAATESAEPKADEQLLSKLTSSVEPSESRTAAREEKIQTEPVKPLPQQQELIREDVLDKLTGGSGASGRDKGKAEKPQAGDSGDA